MRGLAGVEQLRLVARTEGLLTVYGPAHLRRHHHPGGARRHRTRRRCRGPARSGRERRPTRPTLGTAVAGAAGEIDRRLRAVTRDAVGLGSLVPVALTVWAARELLLGRAAPLAWSTALWYAHGLFRDYNTPAS